MKISDDSKSELLKGGRLMELANFLTTFQSHFLPEGGPGNLCQYQEGVLVSPLEIQSVFNYRELLEQKGKLEDKLFIAEETGKVMPVLLPLSRKETEAVIAKIESVQKQIDDFPEHLKLIHHLLQRFEVWSTKIIAQQTFVAQTSSKGLLGPEDVTKVNHHCCFSPFLNLPCSGHFCQLLPETSSDGPPVKVMPSAFHKHSVQCCTLPLPPNKSTWKEFARISKMMNLLDTATLKKVYKSPCFNFDLQKSQKNNQAYNQAYQFKCHDLVPLWVRAQRNTQAMRHLCLLYEIRTINDNSGTNREGSLLKVPYFQAILRGNPANYLKQRIVDTSPLVDQLIEWAVTNQSIFTYRHVKFYTQTALLKRNRKHSAVGEVDKKPRKRLRPEPLVNSGTDLNRMTHACRSYILRWFARRHRKVATILYTSKLGCLELDIGCMAQDRSRAEILMQKVEQGIREYVQKAETTYENDRTFARLDRRLGIPNRLDGKITFSSQVQTLLDALGEAAPPGSLDPLLIRAAKSDFQEMCDHFFPPSSDAFETAFELLDSPSNSQGSIAKALLDAPAPWKNMCSACNSKDPTETCVNCEKVFHKTCTTNCKSVPINDIIHSYQPLEELCRLKLPTDVPLPDFRNGNGVEWTIEEIIIDRPLTNSGQAMPLGLALSQSEESLKSFQLLKSGLISDLAKMIARDKKKLRKAYPLALSYKGCLITEVHQEGCCGERAGIQAGDVMFHLELLEFHKADDAAKYESGKSFDFKDLSKLQRLELLQLQTRKIKVKVMRPKNKDILGISNTWYNGIIHLNKARAECLLNTRVEAGFQSHLWFCGNCLKDTPSIRSEESSSVLKEAQNCRAVIRRIGLESYALPFISEEIKNGAVENTRITYDAISFRRLDSMMTSIIDQESLDSPPQVSTRAFFMPPWASNSGNSKRLSWAPPGTEKRPMQLLCNAMDYLLDSSSADVSTERETARALFRHFLFSFSSWCVLATKPSSTCPRTSGPPDLFKAIHPPWLVSSCKMCTGRPCVDTDHYLCDSPSCSRKANSVGFQMQDIGMTEVMKISEALEEYTERASLVGTTLLVRPSDPLVAAVSKIVQVDHSNRPVEFIVASYLPPDFGQEILRGRPKDDVDNFNDGDGIFHLLPVVTAHQMAYLLERCTLRKKTRKLDSESGLSWSSLDVLQLSGVARYSFSVLKKKIHESDSIRRAIDTAVASLCLESMMEENSGVCQAESVNGINMGLLSPTSALATSGILQCDLLESLFAGNDVPAVIRKLCDEDSSVLDNSDFADSPTKWRIISKSTEREYADQFGVSCLQVGLESFNSLSETSLDVLALPGDNCDLFYSDLHYKNDKERQSLEEVVPPDSLRHPDDCLESKRIQILLTRSIFFEGEEDSDSEYEPDKEDQEKATRSKKETRGKYKGIGWGFEVVSWRDERMLRVGRICPMSPAWHAGLRTNDILISVGGKRVNRFGDIVELVKTLLGATSCRIRKDVDTVSEALTVIDVSKCSLDSVVIIIDRPTLTRHTMQKSGYRNQVASLSQIWNINQNPPSRSPENNMEPVNFETNNWGHNAAYTYNPAYPSTAPIRGSPPTHQTTDATYRHTNMRAIPQQVSAERPSQPQVNNSSLQNLLFQINGTYNQREEISVGHLYYPAKNGIILTYGETAVLLECIASQVPKLGLRLLSPRYNYYVLYEQLNIMKKWTHETILSYPKIPQGIFQKILELDFKRATSSEKPETGDYIFQEGEYRYRMPVACLPIDRYLEKLMKERINYQAQALQQQGEQAQYPQQNQAYHQGQAQYPQQNQYNQTNGEYPNQAYNNYQQQNPTSSQGWNYIDLTDGSDLPGDRIRGGGDGDDTCTNENDNRDEVAGMTSLASVPFEKWNTLLDMPVHAIVYDKDDNENMVVGLAKPSLEGDEGNIRVEVYYHNTAGYLEEPMMIEEADSEDVFLVTDTDPLHAGKFDEEACVVVRKLRKRDRMFSQSVKSVEDVAAILQKLKQKKLCLSSLRMMSRHLNSLGELPDGRHLVWIFNDPAALYISASPLDVKIEEALQVQLKSTLAAAKYQDKHYCPWGCSSELEGQADREPLCFETSEALQEHYSEFHAFGLESDAMDIGRSERFVRIQDGQPILDLCADLTSAICVQAPSLVKDTVKIDGVLDNISPGMKFAKSPTGQRLLLIPKDGLVRKVIEIQSKMKRSGISGAAHLFYLWDVISQLFDIEGTGAFRHTHDELFLATFSSQSDTERSQDKTSSCKFHACAKGNIGCSLCTLPWEKTIMWSDKSGKMATTDEYCGVGCSLIGNVMSSGGSKLDPARLTPGLLGEAKDMLLKTASFVPDSLKLSELPVDIDIDPLAEARIWDQQHFEIWKGFVMDASSTLMLSQAYVTLLASIQKNKLPNWWKCESTGWSTAQVIMANPSLSFLQLHIYVLDGAIAEFLCSALQDSPAAQRVSSGSTKDRVEKYSKLAKKVGFPKFNGVHNEVCYVCEDGGLLLCCDLCENTAHPNCFDPPVPEDLDAWICSGCINDINSAMAK